MVHVQSTAVTSILVRLWIGPYGINHPCQTVAIVTTFVLLSLPWTFMGGVLILPSFTFSSQWCIQINIIARAVCRKQWRTNILTSFCLKITFISVHWPQIICGISIRRRIYFVSSNIYFTLYIFEQTFSHLKLLTYTQYHRHAYRSNLGLKRPGSAF